MSTAVRQPPAGPHRSPPAPPQTNLSIYNHSRDPILSTQPLKQVLATSHGTALAGGKQPKTAQNSLRRHCVRFSWPSHPEWILESTADLPNARPVELATWMRDGLPAQAKAAFASPQRVAGQAQGGEGGAQWWPSVFGRSPRVPRPQVAGDYQLFSERAQAPSETRHVSKPVWAWRHPFLPHTRYINSSHVAGTESARAYKIAFALSKFTTPV